MKTIWKQPFDLDYLNAMSPGTLGQALGILITEIGPDYLAATMPVGPATVQPYRMLHGGASAALAETLGSVASTMCIPDLNKEYAVGLEVNANHLRGVMEGQTVRGVCKPARVGRLIHVWNIEIFDEKGHLACVSRLTVAIIPRP